MSDFDPNDIIGNDFDEADIIPEQEVAPSISKAKSLLKGAEQGVTMGMADELSGATGAMVDTGQAFLNKITGGLVPQSPSQVNKELLAQGFGGDIPSSTYSQFRDEARKEYAQAEEANPASFMTGDLGSSVLLNPLGSIGTATKGLSTLQKAGKLGLAGTGLAAAESYGRSENEGLDLASDVAKGAGIGLATGAGLPIVGKGLEGLGSVAKHILPSDLRDAVSRSYQKGQQGVDVTSPEFVSDTYNKMRSTTDEAAGVISSKQQKIAEEVASAKKSVQSTIDKSKKITETKMSDIEKTTQDYLEKLKESQTATNEATKKSLEKQTVKTAKTLQNDLESVRKNLGDQYNKIDSMAKDAGVQVDSTPVLNEFFDALAGTDLTPPQIEAIKRKFGPETGIIDFAQFQDLKRKMYDLSSPAESPRLRFLAKKAYGGLGSSYESTLRSNGLNDIADKLTDTNKKWSVYANMDDFIEGVAPDRLTKETYASPTTIKTIKNLSSDKAEDIAKMERFKEYNQMLFPQNNLQEAQDISQKIKQASNFTPNIPVKEDALKAAPGYQDLQSSMDVLKSNKIRDLSVDDPEVNKILNVIKQTQGDEAANQLMSVIGKMQPDEQINVLKQFGSNPENIKKKILGMIPEMTNKNASPVLQKETSDLFNVIAKEKGNESASSLQKNMQEISKDFDLGNIINREGNNVPSSIKGMLGNTVRNTAGSVAGIANKAGRSAKFQELINQYQKLKPTPNTAIRAGSSIVDDNRDTSEALVKAQPDEIKQVANDLRAKHGAGASKIAETLDKAAEGDRQKRNALMFSTMQDPNQRKMLNDLKDDKNDEE